MRIHFQSMALVILLFGLGTLKAQPPKVAPGPAAVQAGARAAADFAIEGTYVEACTCKATCPTEVSGELVGCDGIGAFQIDKGAYGGQDISATRVAFVAQGEWVHFYLDAPDAAKRSALEKFIAGALAGMGTDKAPAQAKIEFSGKDGAYTVKIDGGRVLSLQTEPVMGGDHKTPVAIQNTQHPLNPTLYQGRAVQGEYKDGAHNVTIEKGRNSFFNAHMKAAGKA